MEQESGTGQRPRRSVGAVIMKEVREVIPPTVFFFFTFTLLLVTQALVLEGYGVDTLDMGKAAIGALLVGKILLIADKLPFIDRFPDRPLIWNTLWKALIYNIGALLFRYLEAVIPLAIDHGFGAANEQLFASIHWPHFILVQLWLAVLFVVYCGARELIRSIGPERVRALFLGGAAAG